MGDRAVIQFKATEEDQPINLYMHWGGSERYTLLADALEAARPRWSDAEYATRICVSQIVGEAWSGELNFGLSVGDDNSRQGSYDVPCVVWDRKIVRFGDALPAQLGFEEFIEFAGARSMHPSGR